MPRLHSGSGDVWDDLFGDSATDGQGPRDVLIGALSSLPEPEFPEESLRQVCRVLRGAVRWGEPPGDVLMAASGLRAALLPSDDFDLWFALAAGMMAPRGTSSNAGVAWKELDDADWLGAILFMARGGPGTRTTPDELVRGIASCPETRGEIDGLHAGEISRAFEALAPLWRALGAVGSPQAGRPLTPLGHWGLPLALLKAWEGR